MAKISDYNNLKAWIEKYSAMTGLPVYKIANRAKVSRASIYNWMNDTSRPDSETLLRVAQVFAEHTDIDAATIQAEGLRQYKIRPEGRGALVTGAIPPVLGLGVRKWRV